MKNIANRLTGKEKNNIREKISKRNANKIKTIFIKHIINNIKEYAVISLFFLIGVILGVIVINNTEQSTQLNIQGYIQSFINSLKSDEYQIDTTKLLQCSVINNIKLAILIWFVGSTVIGMPLIYGIASFRGYCLGYTISAIIATLGSGKGILFAIVTLLPQNLLAIPAILALSVSGIRLYKSIMQDRHKENIKIAIIKHSMFSVGILIILVISAFLEAYISSNLIMSSIKYL